MYTFYIIGGLIIVVICIAFLIFKPVKKIIEAIGNGKAKTIEFVGDNSTLFYKVNIVDAEKQNYEVIVPPTHTAFIIENGVISDELSAGKKELKRNADLKNVSVIFISKTARVQAVWGTPITQKVKYVDPKIGIPIEVGAFGKMELKVADASKFYLEVVASFGEKFETKDLEDFVRTKMVSKITAMVRNTIERAKLSYFEFDRSLEYLQDGLLPQLKNIFIADYGLVVCDFIVENLNITEENESKIKEVYQKEQDRINKIQDYRAQRAFDGEMRDDAERDTKRYYKFRKEILGDEDDIYKYERDRKNEEEDRLLRIKHEEEDRQWKRDDKIIDTDADLKKNAVYFDAVKSAGWQDAPKTPDEKTKLGNFCKKCGNSLTSADMYCPVCGTPAAHNPEMKECPSCHKSVSINSDYCPFCGGKMKS